VNKIFSQTLITSSSKERRQFLLIFTPILDHESSNPVFPGDLTTLIHRGVKVPYLLGFTNCEGSFILKSNFFGCEYICILSSLNISVMLCRTMFCKRYLLLSDIFVLRGITQTVDIQINNDNSGKTYLYQFSYESETSLIKKISDIDFPGIAANKFKTLMNLI